MVWLFGQIWLWLIIAFALGALTAWLVLRPTRRPKPAPEPEPVREPEPEPLEAERTQFIPAAWQSPGHEHPRETAVDDEPEPVGHREGRLPLPPQRGAEAEDWPAQEEPAWPEADDLPEAAPRWPHQPGRGG